MTNENFLVTSWAGFAKREIRCGHCREKCCVGVCLTVGNSESYLCRGCGLKLIRDIKSTYRAKNQFDEIVFVSEVDDE